MKHDCLVVPFAPAFEVNKDNEAHKINDSAFDTIGDRYMGWAIMKYRLWNKKMILWG